jgi:hypothetical protein
MDQEKYLGLDQLAEFLSGVSQYFESTEAWELVIDPTPLHPALVEWLETLFTEN